MYITHDITTPIKFYADENNDRDNRLLSLFSTTTKKTKNER